MPGSRLLGVTAVVAVVVAACVPTGERPSLGEPVPTTADPEAPTGVAEVDAVLAVLDAVDGAQFTADYAIVRKLGNLASDATVTQAPPRRTVQVDDTVFVTGEDAEDRTCSMTTRACEPGLVEQRISDVVPMGSSFYGAGAAARLRTSTGRRSGQISESTRDLAGLQASCVTVPVAGGSEEYCVAPQGPIAYLDTADVSVELRSLSDHADPIDLVPVSTTSPPPEGE